MREYTEQELGKTAGRTKFKKFLKNMVGKEVNEDKEKQKLMEKFIKKNLSKEQRKLMKEEIREANKRRQENEKDGDPMFDITKGFLAQKIGSCRCQVLRSSCNWSTGIRVPEHSILNAYIDLIKNAEKFVYIENQFFMSNAGSKGIIKNTIAKAIKERVIEAKKNNEQFRVYIFIPLMPGFEGDVLDSSSQVLKLQIRFQQETILKGPSSLYTMLKKEKINPRDYIRFFGLRNHDVFKDGPKHEMIYIHSKCLIVDDRILIVGSANINDRSMLGTRDSEVCVLVQDEEMVDSKMGGEHYEVGRTVHDFRKKLMAGKSTLKYFN